MELIDRSVDPAEKAELGTLLEDIQSGEARWIEVQPENKIRTQGEILSAGTAILSQSQVIQSARFS